MNGWMDEWMHGWILFIQPFLTEASDVLLIQTVLKSIRLNKRDICVQNPCATDSSQILLSVSRTTLHRGFLEKHWSLHSRAFEALSLSRAVPSVVRSDP